MTKWGQTENKVRTLLYDEIFTPSYLLLSPAGQPPTEWPLSRDGRYCTLLEMGAKVPSPGTPSPGRACG
jgi:hypothetical protein